MERLPRDIQIYILTIDLQLLLVGRLLSKGFYQRLIPFWYQRYNNKYITQSEIQSWLATLPAEFGIYTQDYDPIFVLVKMVKSNYQGTLFARKFTDQIQFSNGKVKLPDFLKNSEFPYFLDLKSISAIITRRRTFVKYDPNYISNFVTKYLETFVKYNQNYLTHIDNPTADFGYTISSMLWNHCYLTLNLSIIFPETYPPYIFTNVNWSHFNNYKDIKFISQIKKLVGINQFYLNLLIKYFTTPNLQ